MSRIYEALKKAGFETTAISTPTEVRLPETEPSASHSEDFVNLAEIGLPRTQEIPPSTSLRFVDIEENCTRSDWRPDPQTNVFANPSQDPEAAEQFRTLRSRLYHLRSQNPLRVILITSPLSGDGKTLTSTNLAQAIVRQADQRVLLIDADLRSSRLHIALGALHEPGLCEYLGGKVDEIAVIQRGQEDGLYFIAGGKAASNASELLSNGRLKRLIQRTTPCFDWIIIDSPPCVPVADASVIAGLCDGTLLVVRAGSTPLSAARKACQELQNRKLIGVVLNAVDEKTLTYSSYRGRGVYGEVTSDDSILKLQTVTEKKDA
jgi:protein-tyrosine kinase